MSDEKTVDSDNSLITERLHQIYGSEAKRMIDLETYKKGAVLEPKNNSLITERLHQIYGSEAKRMIDLEAVNNGSE